jgi:DNA-binding MarR family transcriptional regulator
MVEDNQDKRKQRIFLTEKCFQFCEKNELESQKSIARIYEGINEEQLLVTIQTIMKMETNIEAI